MKTSLPLRKTVFLIACCISLTALKAQYRDSALFNYTGSLQYWAVPRCVSQITCYMWGAGGGPTGTYPGSNWGLGGAGAFMAAVVDVSGIDTLGIMVGQGPMFNLVFTNGTYGGGGCNSNASKVGAGGGRSALQVNGQDILTAGGGGGAGAGEFCGYISNGGGGGNGANASNGISSCTCNNDFGLGGTALAGGAGGINCGNNIAQLNGYPGSQYQGGNCNGNYETGGAGGGGYYGGGSGAAIDDRWRGGGGGGGGSSYPTAPTIYVTTIIAALPGQTNCWECPPLNNMYPGGYNVYPFSTYYYGAIGCSGYTTSPTNGYVVILYNSTMEITLTANPENCYGGNNGSAAASVGGGDSHYAYSWSGGGGSDSIATGLTAGAYTLTITDSTGCATTASVNISQPNQLSVSSFEMSAIICNGGSNGSATLTTSGGISPYTYLWSNGNMNTTITGVPAGNYTITVTDSNSCQATASVNITQPQALILKGDSTNDNGNCNGSAWVQAAGGVNPYTYLWNPSGEKSDSIYAQCYGSYCCTVTDNNGCIDSVCVIINISTGIEQLSVGSGQWSVFPNPSTGIFTIAASHAELVSASQTIEIYNVFGQRVYFWMLKQVQHDNLIDLSNEPNGVYFYRVVGENGSLIGEGKLLLQK